MVRCISYQGCGARNQSLDPGSGSRYAKFFAPYRTCKSFWLRSKMIWTIENHCIICTARLHHELGLWNLYQNFRLRLQPPKIACFGLRLNRPASYCCLSNLAYWFQPLLKILRKSMPKRRRR